GLGSLFGQGVRPKLLQAPAARLPSGNVAERPGASIARDRPSLGEIAPADQRESLILQKLTKVGAANDVEVTLPPSGTPIRMVVGGTPHLFVVEPEVHRELIRPGRQWRERLLVRLEPPIGGRARIEP